MLEKARKFMYRNARALDLARWNYLFEDGDKEQVIKYLQAYQNDDGGFGYALEPDCWNIKSTPLQTWTATKIIKEIALDDKDHPLIKDILKYLTSGDEFDGQRWHGLNTVATNNDYPHAPWWSYTKEHESSYNPTASLAGFILKYACKQSLAYNNARVITKEVYQSFKNNYPLESMHEVACLVELYEYLKECNICDLVDLEEFKCLLQQQIKKIITYDKEIWHTDYICKPSMFITNKQSDFYKGNEEICNYEKEFIKQTQNINGTWNITWSWDDYVKEWAISENWWKADIIIKNVTYSKMFD